MTPTPLDVARSSRFRTRLEASLLRLQAALSRGNHSEAISETLYAEWQNRWVGRRDELARRLTAIDSQLDSWAPKNGDAPRLAVLTDVDETELMPSLEID